MSSKEFHVAWSSPVIAASAVLATAAPAAAPRPAASAVQAVVARGPQAACSGGRLHAGCVWCLM